MNHPRSMPRFAARLGCLLWAIFVLPANAYEHFKSNSSAQIRTQDSAKFDARDSAGISESTDFRYVVDPCRFKFCFDPVDTPVWIPDFAYVIQKYLTKGGNLAPKPEIEYGEPGYYDTYYGRVDPAGERQTLAAWKTVNGFDQYSYSKIRVRYINAYDLGFGRDMNCLGTSCYVTNYIDPKGANTKAATVTMERMYKWGRTFLAFFVYDETGQRTNRITLDSEGPKSVPEVCYSCHKGYTTAGGNPAGGVFLPWDKGLFENWPGKPTVASQSEDFRRLNYNLWQDANIPDGSGRRNDVLATLIEDWYGGPPYYGTSFGEWRLPNSDWYSVLNNAGQIVYSNGTPANCASSPMPAPCVKYFDERSLYKNVYAKYCRTCHVSHGKNVDTHPSNQGVVFDTAALFDSYGKSAACGNNATMPHAELTDDRFKTDVLNFTNGTSKTPEQVLCD